ncbi:MAG: FAD-binding protein, partial [Armatimonadota bacterium]
MALRGAGRSYGDAATLREGIVLDLTAFDPWLEIDPASGRCEVSASVTLAELCREALSHGWWPPVVTGTSRITMGGAVAMNVHGKNAFRVGPIGEHVIEVEVLTANGELHRYGQHDPEFAWIFGSAGMLGVVTRIVLQLVRVDGGAIRVEEARVRSWDQGFAAF